MWMFLALLNSAVFAGIAVIDKRLIDRHISSLPNYYVWIGFAMLIYGVVFMAIGGFPDTENLWHTVVAGLSGLAWGLALVMMFFGFKIQEVSRASAMIFTFPVFVALFAVVFMGETLVPLQWLAIVVVVMGGVLISVTGPGGGRAKFTKIVPVLLGAALLIATGHLTAKYALEEISVSLVTSWHFLGVAAVLLCFWRRDTVPNLRRVMSKKEPLILMLVAEGVLVPIALLAQIIATNLGPVSLVATITGTHPIFVVLYTAVLSMPGLRIMNESLNRNTLVVKGASVTLIIGGVASLGLLADRTIG